MHCFIGNCFIQSHDYCVLWREQNRKELPSCQFRPDGSGCFKQTEKLPACPWGVVVGEFQRPWGAAPAARQGAAEPSMAPGFCMGLAKPLSVRWIVPKKPGFAIVSGLLQWSPPAFSDIQWLTKTHNFSCYLASQVVVDACLQTRGKK